MPMNPGVCCPPPVISANEEKVIPTGVCPENSRSTIMMPPVPGRTQAMHSKQPHEVMGSSIMEYAENLRNAPLEAFSMKSLMPFHWPSTGSTTSTFLTGRLPPCGFISYAAFPSSQL